MQKPSQAAPTLPVWSGEVKHALAAERTSFQIDRVASFKSRNGPAWRCHVARHDTGEQGIVLFSANDVRDQQMQAFASIIDSTGDAIGPCLLAYSRLDNGRETWEIIDAPEPAVTKK